MWAAAWKYIQATFDSWLKNLDWSDIIFLISGFSMGASLTILWLCFDNVAEWDSIMRIITIFGWGTSSVMCFHFGVQIKQEHIDLFHATKTPMKK